MVTKVISELQSVSRLKIFPETGPRLSWSYMHCNGHTCTIHAIGTRDGVNSGLGIVHKSIPIPELELTWNCSCQNLAELDLEF